MGRPRKDPSREDTDVLILRAAARAFAENGYARTRLADVAAEVGIRRPSLLYHFRTKQALYDAVVTRVFAGAGAAVAPTLGLDGSPGNRLDALVTALTDFASANPDAIGVVLRELVDPSEVGGALVTSFLGGFVDLIEGAIDSPPPVVPVRAAIMHLVVGYMLRRRTGDARLWGPADADGDVLRLARQLLVREA